MHGHDRIDVSFAGLGAADDVARYPFGRLLGMLTPNEQAYLYAWAARAYDGRGAVVDLGCWLGTSTIPLAEGLAANPRANGAVVDAYDQFVWESWMASATIPSLGDRYRDGDSFLPEYRERTAPYAGRIRVHAGDLNGEHWRGGPIALLFNDVSKSWSLAATVLREFWPAAGAGALIVEQDFVHAYCYWLHLIAWAMRDRLEPVGVVPQAASFVFRRKEDAASGITSVGPGDFSAADVDAAYDYALSIVPPDGASTLLAAKARCLFERGDRAGVDATWSEVLRLGAPGYYAYNIAMVEREIFTSR
ncbi:MAG: hypothetical protein JWM87_338 [Candidatus Eremiobacteraeota bacterium]|nr:hypothetical protein [Candidatus Eremiobacteraeota bacterium]